MKIGVIADDLTGANATGVRLTKQGFRAATMVYYDQPPLFINFDAVIVDTDSRYARKEISQNRVKKVLENFIESKTEIICKRIDSTVRGNMGIEIDTLLSQLGKKSIAIVVASFPESGRITSGGYLLVNGVPVQATDVAKDPVTPLTQSYVPEIIQKQSIHPVSHIGLETILSGEIAIAEELRAKINQGGRILVLDAVTNEEIEDIANAMAMIRDYQMIPVDPGPLTAEYSKAYSSQSTPGKKVVVTIGSVTSHSEDQLNYLIEKTKAEPIYVNAKSLASLSSSWDNEIGRVINRVLDEMNRQEIIIITTQSPHAKLLDLKEISKQEGTTQDHLAKRIADGLAKITRIVFEKSNFEIGGCFSSGGDVTASLCAIGGAKGIHLNDEVVPLIAYGQFIGGRFDGTPLITKGGMAGDKKAIYKSVKHLMTISASSNRNQNKIKK